MRRIFKIHIAWHLLAMSALLVALLWGMGPRAPYTTDEGLAVLQERQLHNSGAWTYSVPTQQLDPTGDATLMQHSEVGTKGRTFYAKHVTYPLVLGVFDRVGGRAALFASSMCGLVLASFFTFLVARRLGLSEVQSKSAMWALALASPLFFDGFEILAHSLAAAASAALFAALLSALKRDRPHLLILSAFVLSALAALLRSEAVFLGPAIVVALFTFAADGKRFSYSTIGLSVATFGGSVTAYVIDRFALLSIVGRSVFSIPGNTQSWLPGRVESIGWTMLFPNANINGATVLLFLAFVLFVLAGIAFRTKAASGVTRYGLLVGAALCEVVAAVSGVDSSVPGLLIAFPLGVFGAIVLPKTEVVSTERSVALAAAALSALAVFATQYATGGGPEWGGRYFAYLLPIWVPMAVVGISKVVDGNNAQRVVVPLMVAALSLDGIAFHTFRTTHHMSRATESIVNNAIASVNAPNKPIVIWTERFAPQYMWGGVDTEHWLIAYDTPLDTLLKRAHEASDANVIVVTDQDDLPTLSANGYVLHDTIRVPHSDRQVLVTKAE